MVEVVAPFSTLVAGHQRIVNSQEMTAQKISDKIKTVGHEAHKTDPKFNRVFFHIGLKTLTQ
jgi:hypothetical protein